MLQSPASITRWVGLDETRGCWDAHLFQHPTQILPWSVNAVSGQVLCQNFPDSYFPLSKPLQGRQVN